MCTYTHTHIFFFVLRKDTRKILKNTSTQTEYILKQILIASASPDSKFHASETRIILGYYLEISLFIKLIK